MSDVWWLSWSAFWSAFLIVAVLPGVRDPEAIGFRNDEVRRASALPPGLR